jgi:hypothetical protein
MRTKGELSLKAVCIDAEKVIPVPFSKTIIHYGERQRPLYSNFIILELKQIKMYGTEQLRVEKQTSRANFTTGY